MTLADLKNRALKRLRVLAAGETAAAHVDDIVADAYTFVYNELNSDVEKLATWTSTGAIPDKVASYVIDLVVYQSADEFYVPEQRILRLEAKAEKSMKMIRRLQAKPYIPRHSAATYY